MIRVSAALVAVAIGVLIGGIATSELLLVYIAIVVSAVALVALAIGVALNREELFGDGQGLAPASAGASPVSPDRSGERQEKIPSGAHVTPLSPLQGTAGGYAAVVGTAAPTVPSPAATGSAPSGAVPSAARPAAAGQGHAANPVPPWETPAAREPWSPSAPDWISAGQGGRAASGAAASGAVRAAEDRSRAPSARQDTSAGGKPGSSAPSWFDRLGDPAGATSPAPGSGSGRPWPDRDGNAPRGRVAPADTATPGASATRAEPVISDEAVPGDDAVSGDKVLGDTVSGDEGDDWPTRYSWLDDETDGAGEAVKNDAQPESDPAVPAGTAGDAGPDASAPVKPGVRVVPDEPVDSGEEAAGDEPEPPAAPTVAAPVMAGPSADADAGEAGTPGAAPVGSEKPLSAGTAKGAGAAVEQDGIAEDADVAALAGHGDAGHGDCDEPAQDGGAVNEADPAAKAEGDSETGSEPSADASPVSVVPGVPRYHEPDCVLIRFISSGDVQKLTIPQAREAGCTPCAACQPEG